MTLRSRTVTGTARHADLTPWSGARVTIYLRDGSITEEGTFPPDGLSTTTDENGAWSLSPWCNEDGLVRSSYLCVAPGSRTVEFTLPFETGASITIEELEARGITDTWTSATAETLLAITLANLANTSNPALGDAMLGFRQPFAGAVGRTVHDKLAESISLSDFGAVADGTTDLATALNLAMESVPPGTVARLQPSATSYILSDVVDWKVRGFTLDARGCNFLLDAGGKIKVNANDGTLYGGTYRFVPPAGQQGSGNLFAVKNPDDGDVAINATGWTLRDLILDNVTARFQKMGRINVRIPLHCTNLLADTDGSETVLPLVDASRIVDALWVRVLLDNGSVVFRQVLSVDTVLNTVTIAAALGYAAGELRRVAGVTKTDSSILAGATLIPVESTLLHEVGQFTWVMMTSGAAHASQVLAINPGVSITIADQLPGPVSNGAAVQPCNNGVFPTGTDIAGYSKIVDCEVRYLRANWAIEFGGVVSCTFSGNHVHNIYRLNDPNDVHYGTDYLPSTLESNPNYGEGIKVTAGSDKVIVEDNVWRHIGRNAVDLYAGGSAIITRNHFLDQVKAGAIEAKWVSSDLNDPKPIIISENRFENMPGHAILAGAPNSVISSNIIQNAEESGIYVNGARNAQVISGGDEELEEGVQNFTENVAVIGNRCMDSVAGVGIQVVESTGVTVMGNTCSGNFYNIVLNRATKCAVIGNITRDHQTSGQDIRIQGDPGLDCLHVIANNITTDMTGGVQLYDVDADFVVINGLGVENGLAAGAQPTLSKWPVGIDVINGTDNKIFKRSLTAWIALN